MTQFSHYLLFLYKLLPNHPWFRMQWHHLDRKHLLCFNLPLLSPPLPKQLNNISWLWCNSKQTVEVVTEMVAVFSKQWSWQSSRKCLQYIIWHRYKITNFKYHDGELRAPKNLSIDHHSPTLQSNCKKKKKNHRWCKKQKKNHTRAREPQCIYIKPPVGYIFWWFSSWVPGLKKDPERLLQWSMSVMRDRMNGSA